MLTFDEVSIDGATSIEYEVLCDLTLHKTGSIFLSILCLLLLLLSCFHLQLFCGLFSLGVSGALIVIKLAETQSDQAVFERENHVKEELCVV